MDQKTLVKRRWSYLALNNRAGGLYGRILTRPRSPVVRSVPVTKVKILSITGIGIVIRYTHNLLHWFIQSLNPILKILKFKYLQIRHKTRNQLASKAQSFPRKSSNTTSSTTAHHARDFTWNWGCSSNSHPLEDSDNQILSSRDAKGVKCLGYARGGEGVGGRCWSFDLTDT